MTVSEIIRIRQALSLQLAGQSEDTFREQITQREEATLERWRSERSAKGDKLVEEFLQFREQAKQWTLPTDLQDPTAYHILKTLLDECVTHATNIGTWNGEKPVIASENMGDVNGYCFWSAVDQMPGIVIDDSILIFALLLGKMLVYAMAEATPEGGVEGNWSPDHMIARIVGDPQWFQRFDELLTAYLEEGSPAYAPSYTMPPSPVQHFVEAMIRGIERFIVAHECGHIYHKDLHDPALQGPTDHQSLIQPMDNKGGCVYHHRQLHEHMADVFAMRINAAAVNDKVYSEMELWGPFVFFQALDTLESALFFTKHGRHYSTDEDGGEAFMVGRRMIPATHPDSVSRMAFLVFVVESAEWPEELRERIKGIQENVRKTFIDIEIAWTEKCIAEKRTFYVHERWTGKIHQLEEYLRYGKDIMAREGNTGPDNTQTQ